MFQVKWQNPTAEREGVAQFEHKGLAMRYAEKLLADTNVGEVAIKHVKIDRNSKFDNDLLSQYVETINGELTLEIDQHRYTLRDLMILRKNIDYWQAAVGMLVEGYHQDREPSTEPGAETITYSPKHGDTQSAHQISAWFGKIVKDQGPMTRYNEFKVEGGIWKPYHESGISLPRYRFYANGEPNAWA